MINQMRNSESGSKLFHIMLLIGIIDKVLKRWGWVC